MDFHVYCHRDLWFHQCSLISMTWSGLSIGWTTQVSAPPPGTASSCCWWASWFAAVEWHSTRQSVFDADLSMSLHSWLSSAQPGQVDPTDVQWGWGLGCMQASPFSWYTLSLSRKFRTNLDLWGRALSSCRIASSPIFRRYGTAVGWRIIIIIIITHL